MPALKEIPREWLIELEKIQTASGTLCILAGGALRDLNNDKVVKDIDLFLEHTPTLWDDLKMVYPNIVSRTGELPEYEEVDTVDLFEVEGVLDYPIQFIVKDKVTPKRLMSSFDIDICKIWTDGIMYEYDHAYQKDVQEETITISSMRDSYDLISIMNHASRIHRKYPEFNLRISQGLMSKGLEL